MIDRISVYSIALFSTTARVKRLLPFSLLLTAFLLSAPSLLIAQDAWRVVPMESTPDHQPLPYLKAIGIPATATFQGKEHKAWVFIFGPKKGRGVYHAMIEIYIPGFRQFIPNKELEVFDGEPDSAADMKARTIEVAIKRSESTFQATNILDLHSGNYPSSLVQDENNNNVFGSGVFTHGPKFTAWVALLRQMSAGFDHGHISFGGTAPASKIEIAFSGSGIEPLLKDLLRYVGP